MTKSIVPTFFIFTAFCSYVNKAFYLESIQQSGGACGDRWRRKHQLTSYNKYTNLIT